jgi:Mn2+/Fe2+ NRAMP family transporter
MVGLLFWSSYRRIANVFKWLALVLFAYVLAGFLAHPNRAAVLRFTVIPHIKWSSAYLATL